MRVEFDVNSVGGKYIRVDDARMEYVHCILPYRSEMRIQGTRDSECKNLGLRMASILGRHLCMVAKRSSESIKRCHAQHHSTKDMNGLTNRWQTKLIIWKVHVHNKKKGHKL